MRSAITLAHGLGMVAVAEGVEDTETWRHLGELGCDRIQGYRLSPPIPAEAVAHLRGPGHAVARDRPAARPAPRSPPSEALDPT